MPEPGVAVGNAHGRITTIAGRLGSPLRISEGLFRKGDRRAAHTPQPGTRPKDASVSRPEVSGTVAVG